MLLRCVVLILVLFIAPLAGAQEEPDYDRSGVYISVGGNLGADVFEGVGDADIRNAGGVNVRVGYRFLPYLSAEVEYEYLTGFKTEIDAGKIDLSSWMFSGNAKAYVLTGRIQPYALVGVGVIQAEEKGPDFGFGSSDASFAARFGGGVDMYLGEQVALYAEAAYVLPTSDLEDFRYVSVGFGLQWRF